jgi:sulfite reductase (NADPH) flavoprotein alpha-component
MSERLSTSVFTKDNPFPAHISEAKLLNKSGSAKETRHFVVDLNGSDLTYRSGDSLGVYPSNRDEEVAELLACLGVRGDELVTVPKLISSITIRDALTSKLALAGPTIKFLNVLASKVTDSKEKAELEALLLESAKPHTLAYLEEREFVDLLLSFPSAKLTPQDLVDNMRKLMPRLYSIASSPLKTPTQIHLTVAVVRYTTNQRKRYGVCSTFLADRVILNDTAIPVFVTDSHFKLPEDRSKDVIMVGPGTGIAPFRAFTQELAAKPGPGRAWLFFGDQHSKTDFLYEEEWAHFLSSGILTRLDTAFSRDQEKKVYVQDKMRESSKELWNWLNKGAYFYVCGDAKKMAKDVDQALHEIIAKEGSLSPEEAILFVKQLKKDRRYQRDVY